MKANIQEATKLLIILNANHSKRATAKNCSNAMTLLPPELQAKFASLAYGTMRGVIFAM